MANSFEGKTALVTGASQGIGFAAAEAFAQAGASVVPADVKEDEVREAAQRLSAEGFRTLAVVCDVSDTKEIPIGGLSAAVKHAAYSATKHGVTGPTRSAAVEYITRGVHINAVAPGMIDTPMNDGVTRDHDPEIEKQMLRDQPIGRFGRPEEIATAVLWLASDASSMVVGPTLPVDGGYMAR